MSTITFTALLTQNGGSPATGLTLSDIDFYLYSVSINSGAITEIWNTENPTAEISNTGMYIRQYISADLNEYQYVGRASYGGGSTLDSDNVYVVFAGAEVNPRSTVVVTSPLAEDGTELDLVWGDDYNASESRQITWSSSGWPDITGATVAFKYWNPRNYGDRGSVDMELGSVGGATQTVYLELTAAETKELNIGEHIYRYEVEATISGRKVTLVSSNNSWLNVSASYD